MKKKVEIGKKLTLGLVLTLLLSALLLMASAESSVQYIVSVNKSAVNMRAGASKETVVVDKLTTGKQVKVLGTEGNWTRIRVNGQEGYVMSIFLSSRDPNLKAEAPRYIKSPNSMAVNVREEAGKGSKVKTKLVTGTAVTITDVEGDWAAITIDSTGETGYVQVDFLVTENPYGEDTSSKGGRKVYLISENGGSINIREKPGKQSTVIDQVPSGTEVILLEAGTEWSKIRTETFTGYVQNTFISGTPGEQTTFAYVVSPDSMAVNLREASSKSSRVIDQLVTGTKVEVLSAGANWSEVSVGGKTGYMMNMYLSHETPKEYQSGKKAYVATPDGGTVRMRYGAGTGYDVVTKLDNGTQVEVLASIKGWARVRCGSWEGYIDEQFLSDTRP